AWPSMLSISSPSCVDWTMEETIERGEHSASAGTFCTAVTATASIRSGVRALGMTFARWACTAGLASISLRSLMCFAIESSSATAPPSDKFEIHAFRHSEFLEARPADEARIRPVVVALSRVKSLDLEAGAGKSQNRSAAQDVF